MIDNEKTRQSEPLDSSRRENGEDEAFDQQAHQIIETAESEAVPDKLQDLGMTLGRALEAAHGSAPLLRKRKRPTH